MLVHELDSRIDIHAPRERIWDILSDFPSYPEWNPFVRSVRGELKVGARLDVRLQPPGSPTMRFRPWVTALEPGVGFSWLGRLLAPRVFDGVHCFELRGDGGPSTSFLQSECFRGLLVPLLRRSLDGGTRRGFEMMNKALKARAERARAVGVGEP